MIPIFHNQFRYFFYIYSLSLNSLSLSLSLAHFFLLSRTLVYIWHILFHIITTTFLPSLPSNAASSFHITTIASPTRLLIRNTPESLSTGRTTSSRPPPHHDHEAPFSGSSHHGAASQGTGEARRAVLMLHIHGEASRCVLTHPHHITHSLR